MNEHTEIDINNEKVKRIINAGYEEFGKYGKKKASLNNILKKAGISKGVFYHYFKDKEFLFNFLLTYAVDTTISNLENSVDWSNKDIIRRICDISKTKLEIIGQYPYLIAFSEAFNHDMKECMDSSNITDFRNKFYKENVDLEILRNSSELEEVIHITKWTYKGIFNKLNMKHEEPNDELISGLIEQCERYYKVLSNNLYK